MPLSEDDRRKLDQIEQALRDDDPTFAATVTFVHRRHWAIVEGAAFFIGWLVLLAGVVATQTLLGLDVTFSLAGFLAGSVGMLAVAVFLFGRPQPAEPTEPDPQCGRSN